MTIYNNFHIVNADFETFGFFENEFDLVYSAATIQWIPEEIGLPKVYSILKSGGTFAMMRTYTDYKSANEALYEKIQEVYDLHFRPEGENQFHFRYENVTNYGFIDYERREYLDVREYNADQFVNWTRIQSPQLTIQEPHRTKFLEGIRNAILGFDDRITLKDVIVLDLVRKP